MKPNHVFKLKIYTITLKITYFLFKIIPPVKVFGISANDDQLGLIDIHYTRGYNFSAGFLIFFP